MASLVVSYTVDVGGPSSRDVRKHEQRFEVPDGALMSYWEVVSVSRYNETEIRIWVKPPNDYTVSKTVELPYLMRTLMKIEARIE